MPGEREPRIAPLAQYLCGHPEHPPVGYSSTRREVDAVFVPGLEPAGPTTRSVHPRDYGVLTTDVPHEIDGTVEQHPPEVRVLALAEQVDARLDTDLRSGLGQLRELLVGQTRKEAQRAELIDSHQTVARYRCTR